MNAAVTPPAFKTKTLILCVASSALLVSIAAFRWSLVDLLTPFLMVPIEGFVWLIFGCTLVVSVIAAIQHRQARLKAFLPLAICSAALIAVLTIPFTKIWLLANFHMKQQSREQVVQQILAGTLRPNVQHNRSLIALSDRGSLSAGGNEVVVHDAAVGKFVLFYTFRGILNSAAGFLWVPAGASPRQFADYEGPIAELIPYAPNWYFVSMAP